MIREPKIPMSPEDLPQQRIHEVVALPQRPAEFNCCIGYELFPYGELPKNAPTTRLISVRLSGRGHQRTTGLMPTTCTEDEAIGLCGPNTGMTTGGGGRWLPSASCLMERDDKMTRQMFVV